MKINNQIYDDEADGWWDDESFLHAMGELLNPVRVEYFQRVLRKNVVSNGSRLLDVGCGGGSLAEEFSKIGFQVTGIDISPASIKHARIHATESGSDVEFFVASGDNLPFPDGVFDAVSCCELLEHVENPGQVVEECSRVLKPGGIFLFATPNRTALTWFGLVKLVQDWRLTSVSPPRMHLYQMFIRPTELKWLLTQAGIQQVDLTGIRPSVFGSWERLLILPGLRFGFMHYSEAARYIGLRTTGFQGLAYMGYGRKC